MPDDIDPVVAFLASGDARGYVDYPALQMAAVMSDI
jgi:hypothetical protein